MLERPSTPNHPSQGSSQSSPISTGTKPQGAKLTPEQFIFWFKGMLAVNPKYAREGMNPDEVRTVAQQLDNVFVHVVAPTPEKRRTAPPGFEAMC